VLNEEGITADFADRLLAAEAEHQAGGGVPLDY
jgi:hypothetical protein